MSKKFALIGAAGYIAPRHMEAIQKTGHKLMAAFDLSDSVGILDRYAPDCAFFTDQRVFENFLRSHQLDFVSICSPNFVHSDHIKLALENECNVICEKPLVLEEAQLDELLNYEKKFNRKVFTVLQLRYHDAIISLRDKISSLGNKERLKINLNYITSRGNWYHSSWKGNIQKSGGLSTNIGVHFFDMLTWIFGPAEKVSVSFKDSMTEKGSLLLDRADVDWTLSIDRSLLPPDVVKQGKTTYRSLLINGEEFEFSDGFTELHQTVYRNVLGGNGFGIEDSRPAIRIVEKIRKNS